MTYMIVATTQTSTCHGGSCHTTFEASFAVGFDDHHDALREADRRTNHDHEHGRTAIQWAVTVNIFSQLF